MEKKTCCICGYEGYGIGNKGDEQPTFEVGRVVAGKELYVYWVCLNNTGRNCANRLWRNLKDVDRAKKVGLTLNAFLEIQKKGGSEVAKKDTNGSEFVEKKYVIPDCYTKEQIEDMRGVLGHEPTPEDFEIMKPLARSLQRAREKEEAEASSQEESFKKEVEECSECKKSVTGLCDLHIATQEAMVI